MELLKSLSITCLCLISFVSFGQNKLKGTPHPTRIVSLTENATTSQSIDGTYQFQINKENYAIVLTDELRNRIRISRKASSSVTIQIDEYTNLFLPSTTEINSGGFISLEPVIYI